MIMRSIETYYAKTSARVKRIIDGNYPETYMAA